MNNIDAPALKKLMASGEKFLLVDVREVWEHEVFNIGGLNIPIGDLIKETDKLKKNIPVIFYCEKGIRSVIALQRLEALPNAINFYNLTGGMQAWRYAQDI